MTLLERKESDGLTSAPDAPSTASTTIRIAIADAHRLLVEGLVAILGQPGTGIDVVATAPDWDGLLGHPNHPAEVVVLDHDLDDALTGPARVRELVAAGAHVVVLGRRPDPAAIHAVLRAGALGFVPKTDASETLLQSIRSAAAGELWLDPSLQAMLDAYDVSGDPGLGDRERRALLLYASGRTLRDVAEAMGTTEETVKSYIKRARRKYRAIGIDLGTRALLRRHAAREGWIPGD
ncbi:sigma factor-like helix-turn-helix DNA-binding protein [Herbiconiux sp. SYSU D00978]|uniref:sigma factor-like helix-turn-helix DNA-binding protein n=1 Tax=Herbiconiux sp. SYSU D00978 TaxID=2812562 RepID=UPI001A964A77|nr:response regulator transcription factor [Herbiconiux sp. SYSU D00978]